MRIIEFFSAAMTLSAAIIGVGGYKLVMRLRRQHSSQRPWIWRTRCDTCDKTGFSHEPNKAYAVEHAASWEQNHRELDHCTGHVTTTFESVA